MCIGDWRLGALITPYPSNIVVPALGQGVLKANPQRCGLQFLGTAGGQGAVAEILVLVNGVAIGFNVVEQFTNIITFATHGLLSAQEFRFDNTDILNSATIGIIEYFLPASVLRSSIDEYQRGIT